METDQQTRTISFTHEEIETILNALNFSGNAIYSKTKEISSLLDTQAIKELTDQGKKYTDLYFSINNGDVDFRKSTE